MRKLKRIKDQVIAITGATSGIGLTTARMAVARGAKVILIARNVKALESLTSELNHPEKTAKCFVADVANEDEVNRVAREAFKAFGRIDTWINNAGVSIYGKIEQIPDADSRRLFDTNFWGVVNGSRTAANLMKETGGAIINIGSTLSDRAVPIQGMYSASKHAVKGFTDAFRMELEADEAPISVTLIKPAAIDTPYKFHAKNFLEVRPENPAPVYSPETVAETILHCAENPVRDVFVGGGGKAISVLGSFMPATTDAVMESTMFDAQRSNDTDSYKSVEGLHNSRDTSLTERGGYTGHVSESSLYTRASLRPFTASAILSLGLGAAFLAGKAILSQGGNGRLNGKTDGSEVA